MNIKYEDIENAIYNYWTSSENLKNILDSLSFDNLKTINLNKEYLIDNIKKMLNDKLKQIQYYENLTDKELYEMIIRNDICFIDKHFFCFFKKILNNKFDGNSLSCLINYIEEVRKLQLYNKYIKNNIFNNENKYIDNNDTDNIKEENIDKDFINEYHIDDKFLHIYDNHILNIILKEYHDGKNYRNLVKKYHPDTGFTNEEYIKIINDLKKSKIIS